MQYTKEFYIKLFEHTKILIASMLSALQAQPVFYSSLTFIGVTIGSIYQSLYVFMFSALILTMIDTHQGIKASQKLGIKYDSKLRRKGLVEKAQIYMLLVLIALLVDFPLKRFYDLGDLYIAMTVSFFMVLYEATSIVEKLKIRFPDNKLIHLLSRIFMIVLEEAEQKLVNKVKGMEEIINRVQNDKE